MNRMNFVYPLTAVKYPMIGRERTAKFNYFVKKSSAIELDSFDLWIMDKGMARLMIICKIADIIYLMIK